MAQLISLILIRQILVSKYSLIINKRIELAETRKNPIIDFFKKTIVNITALICNSKYDDYYSSQNLSMNFDFIQSSNIIAFNPKNKNEVSLFLFKKIRFFVSILMVHTIFLM